MTCNRKHNLVVVTMLAVLGSAAFLIIEHSLWQNGLIISLFFLLPVLILLFVIYLFYVILCSHRAVRLYLRLVALIRSLPEVHIHSLSAAEGITAMISGIGYLEQIIVAYQSKMYARYRHLDTNSIIQTVLLSLNNLHIEMEDRDEFFSAVLESAATVIPRADSGSLMILDCNDNLHYKAAIGFDIEKFRTFSVNINHPCLLRNGQHLFDSPCILKHEENPVKKLGLFPEIALSDGSGSTLCAPIIIEGVLFGVLNFHSKSKQAFSDDDLVLINYFANEISLLIRTHNRIEKAIFNSKYDSLTGVYTRGYFEDLCKISVEQARRSGFPLQIVLMDLNNFKEINDNLGHSAGDSALQHFASVYLSLKRNADLFCRYGGDEFVALFYNSNLTGVENYFSLLETHLQKNPLSIGTSLLTLTVSWGCAMVNRDGLTLTELINCADKRMYEHKRTTKNRKF
ncbi:MAG: sensor domain-containing diguanylate cyclase [Spirochaetes bacterium]|jgi:diguanylate cyclase (GGDEF)-like protein|nr:sensor domain-containing diguanylate cyclase [Spirochaetota bacterium]